MGAIKGILLVIVSVLLFISLLAGNIFLTLSLSLDYNNIKTEFSSDILDSVVGDIDVKEVIEENIPDMKKDCEGKTEYVFKEDNFGYTFVIPCDIVAQGSEAIIDYGFNSFIEEIYYEDYDCGFWDCFEKTGSPSFLISEKAQDYWNNKFYFSLIASIILIILIFFLVDKKSSLFIVSGSLLIISSLPFMKLDWALSFFSGKPFLEFLAIFFTKSYAVFLTSLILGIIIFSIGILLKLFGVGFKISNIFSKKDKKISKDEVKQIVKKEISKDNKSDSKKEINLAIKKEITKKEVFKKEKDKKSK